MSVVSARLKVFFPRDAAVVGLGLSLECRVWGLEFRLQGLILVELDLGSTAWAEALEFCAAWRLDVVLRGSGTIAEVGNPKERYHHWCCRLLHKSLFIPSIETLCSSPYSKPLKEPAHSYQEMVLCLILSLEKT